MTYFNLQSKLCRFWGRQDCNRTGWLDFLSEEIRWLSSRPWCWNWWLKKHIFTLRVNRYKSITETLQRLSLETVDRKITKDRCALSSSVHEKNTNGRYHAHWCILLGDVRITLWRVKGVWEWKSVWSVYDPLDVWRSLVHGVCWLICLIYSCLSYCSNFFLIFLLACY